MKFRNKKTGEIIDSKELLTNEFLLDLFSKDFNYFNSKLNKIQEDWEYYHDPKHWFISEFGNVYCVEDVRMDKRGIRRLQEIGNWFDSEEYAKKVVEKFKAFTRLQGKGFKFSNFVYTELCDYVRVNISATVINDSIHDDLELLFGGK